MKTKKGLMLSIRYDTWLRLNEACSDGYLHNQMDIEKADEIINDLLDDLEEQKDEDEKDKAMHTL